MKKTVFAVAALLAATVTVAQAQGTLQKVKDSGTITMGVRES